MNKVTEIPKLPERKANSHKGTYGKVCMIAGSFGMSGAAAIMAKSALRSGTGLSRAAVPESILPIIAAIEPSYTITPLPEDKQGRISRKALHTILDLLPLNDCIGMGPGLGKSNDLKLIIEKIIGQEDLKLVLDADGLNNLSGIKGWPGKVKADIILTPHPGEMKRIYKSVFREEMPDDRVEQAACLAEETNTTVVLKGAGTVVTDCKKYYINDTGNSGLASGGTGDCLTGIITSLRGQGMSAFEAAQLGVYIHGVAGDIAAEKLGQISMIASDVVDFLPEAFKQSAQNQ